MLPAAADFDASEGHPSPPHSPSLDDFPPFPDYPDSESEYELGLDESFSTPTTPRQTQHVNANVGCLPPELFIEIFSFLSLGDITHTLPLVCSYWRAVALTDPLWDLLLHRGMRSDSLDDIELPRCRGVRLRQILFVSVDSRSVPYGVLRSRGVFARRYIFRKNLVCGRCAISPIVPCRRTKTKSLGIGGARSPSCGSPLSPRPTSSAMALGDAIDSFLILSGSTGGVEEDILVTGSVRGRIDFIKLSHPRRGGPAVLLKSFERIHRHVSIRAMVSIQVPFESPTPRSRRFVLSCGNDNSIAAFSVGADPESDGILIRKVFQKRRRGFGWYRCMAVVEFPNRKLPLIATGQFASIALHEVVIVAETEEIRIVQRKVFQDVHPHSAVLALCFDPWRGRLVSGGEDHHVRIYDFRQKQFVKTLSDHSSTVWDIDVDERVLVSAGADGKAFVYDATSDEYPLLFELCPGVSGVAVTSCWLDSKSSFAFFGTGGHGDVVAYRRCSEHESEGEDEDDDEDDGRPRPWDHLWRVTVGQRRGVSELSFHCGRVFACLYDESIPMAELSFHQFVRKKRRRSVRPSSTRRGQ